MSEALSASERQDLEAAVERLEKQTFATRIADYAGRPVNVAAQYLPEALNWRLSEAIRVAIYKSLEIAVGSIDRTATHKPSNWAPKVITGLTGGIGGFFGLAGLPFELPVTTTFMLRSIAQIAQAEGEDIDRLETRLACLEVFALGGRGGADKVNVDYYAVRAVLTKLTGEMATYVFERGALNASSPIVARLVSEVAGRFGLVVTERLAAGAIPVLGAVGGAAVNMVFMDHFQRVAQGHFVIRRLERRHGVETIRDFYKAHAAASVAAKGDTAPRRSPLGDHG
jgi:hypothetical protein